MSLFETGPFTIVDVPVEVLSPDRRRTLRAKIAIAQGRHPANNMPIDEAHHCRDCEHLVRRVGSNRSYLKCDNHRLGRSHCSASDMRASWPACPLFEERT